MASNAYAAQVGLLIDDIQSRLDAKATDFLLSLHESQPDFTAIGLPQAAELPAVKWKLQNIRRLMEENPEKHAVRCPCMSRS